MVKMRFEGGAELAKAFEGLTARVSKRMLRESLEDAAEPMRRAMSSMAPREPGAPDLADNIVISTARTKAVEGAQSAAVAIGPAKAFYYGCVFNPSTYVSTDRGQKAICQIRVGDKVLTQTGEFRSVLATVRYPALEKPDLVTITARYRKGLNHTLTLTRDHKVLAFRDHKHQWIQACDLVVGDVLAKRRKTSWSAGTAKTQQRVCEQCSTQFIHKSRGKNPLPVGFSSGLRFCSHGCRAEWLSLQHKGMKRSDATKALQSSIAKARIESNPESHPNRIMSARGFKSGCEKTVEEWLTTRGLDFRPQHQIGDSFVDFYLPDSNTVIEADGAYWHRDQERDIERDKRILEHDPSVRIIHMHFVDKRFTPPNLQREPIPNVAYVPCNPGPSSFVDPDAFVDTHVLSVKHWRYESGPALLYDITVEGIQSFVASGLVIHNSFQEFGTVHHSAQPFVRPAFDGGVSRALSDLARSMWSALASRGISRTVTRDAPIQSDGRFD